MLDERFLIAKEIIDNIEQNGFQAYFVGGCVRDLLLGNPIKDIDIATSALPKSIMSIFEKVIPVGIEHGTVIVRHKKNSFEVTTFRLDGMYSDQRHPDQVEFIDHIDLDLKRRDFTMNALAMNKNGKIIDLFDGKSDLNNKLIRTVGKGEERFKEDPLRIVRALRFSSQLGFTIEKETLEAMKKIKPEIEKLAIERITSEMTKLVAGESINKGINYLLDTEVYQHLPIMLEYPNILKVLRNKLKPMQSFGEFIALFHYVEPTITINEWCKQWKCSNKTKNKAINLTEALNYYETEGLDHWLVYNLQQDLYPSFLNLTVMLFDDKPIDSDRFKQISRTLPIRSKKDLKMNGNDLVQMFPDRKKGSWIKQKLNQMEREVVMNNIENKYDQLKEWIKWNPPEIN